MKVITVLLVLAGFSGNVLAADFEDCLRYQRAKHEVKLIDATYLEDQLMADQASIDLAKLVFDQNQQERLLYLLTGGEPENEDDEF